LSLGALQHVKRLVLIRDPRVKRSDACLHVARYLYCVHSGGICRTVNASFSPVAKTRMTSSMSAPATAVARSRTMLYLLSSMTASPLPHANFITLACDPA